MSSVVLVLVDERGAEKDATVGNCSLPASPAMEGAVIGGHIQLHHVKSPAVTCDIFLIGVTSGYCIFTAGILMALR